MTPALGIYVHVPFCAARCGYCDFNTYVPNGPEGPRAFVEAARRELDLAAARLDGRPADTVFFGGGTPSLLGAEALTGLLDAIRSAIGVRADAEISTEANPESTDPAFFTAIQAAGFTRVSLGMQSAAPHVLATLERQHLPGRATAAAREAVDAGFEHVSLDLIYGTPGETDADWRDTLEQALAAPIDHLSLYGLTVEPGTRMAAEVRAGRLPEPDDGAQARRFRWADARLEEAGLPWYEISSWARDADARCHHNLGYWRSQDWWGIGPGAHSHLAGTRFWNCRAPSAYAARLARGESPVAGTEALGPEERALETILLGLRTVEGLDLTAVAEPVAELARAEATRGRLAIHAERAVLTREGRLFADGVVRTLAEGLDG